MAQLENPMQLVDWLDDLCVRFVINLPQEELESVERICFQIEEAQWFYEDFIRPLDSRLPSLNLRKFCSLIFQHCPLLSQFSEYHAAAYAEFLAYKTRVPVRGAIMLNEEMNQCVLVKGWKSGAKWSFPRGKINKDEKDLDCAIREVYEETGYDIKEAGLVPEEDSAKYIEVSLREQHMRLYVFRGVPMDTYFAPRTRKEISKIQWYRISDLPAGKQNKGKENDDAYKGSHFYMVAPFLGQLKHWIKQQKRLDRDGLGLAAPEVAALDDGGFGTDVEAVREGFASEAPEVAGDAEAEAGHLQFLLSRLQKSTQEERVQQVAEDQPSKTDKLANELKKLLSIGGPQGGVATSGQPEGTKPPAPDKASSQHKSSLMSLLRPESSTSFPPQTPLEQVDLDLGLDPNPPQPQNPHHRTHTRQIDHSEMLPPPPFGYAPAHYQQPNYSTSHTSQQQPQNPPHSHLPQYSPQHSSLRQPPSDMSQTPPNPRLSLINQNLKFGVNVPVPTNPAAGHPHMHSAPAKRYSHLPSYPGPGGEGSRDAMSYQSSYQGGPMAMPPSYSQAMNGPTELGPPTLSPAGLIPSGSGVAHPKLNAQSLALLNTFKLPTQAHEPVSAISRRPQSLELPSHIPKPAELAIHPQDQPLELHGNGTRHISQSRDSMTRNVQVTPPNPRSTQQNTLLGLFQKPQPETSQQLHNAPLQAPVPGLVELSAQPTPHNTIRQGNKMRAVDGTLMGPPGPGPIRRDQHRLTTATVSGPLNAPNFETMSRNTKPVELGNGQPQYAPRSVPQPAAQEHGQVPVRGIVPAASPPVPVHTIGSSMVLEAPQPFHPSNLLQRQQQLTPSNVLAALAPPQKGPNLFDRRQQAPADQKSTLMGLFGKPAVSTTIPSQQARRQLSQTGSPVSPIPDRRAPVKQYDPRGVAPASVGPKSRINSFAESNGSTRSGTRTPISTMDKNFLLGFLEDVANGEQGK